MLRAIIGQSRGHSRYTLWGIVISKHLFLETNADASRNKFQVDLQKHGGRDAGDCMAVIHCRCIIRFGLSVVGRQMAWLFGPSLFWSSGCFIHTLDVLDSLICAGFVGDLSHRLLGRLYDYGSLGY